MEDWNQKSDEAGIPDRSDENTAAKGKAALKPRIIDDPVLGIPVLRFGDDAPVLASEQVEEILSDFP